MPDANLPDANLDNWAVSCESFSFNDLKDRIEVFSDKLFDYIGELPDDEFFSFIHSLWWIEYDNKNSSRYWKLKVKLKILPNVSVGVGWDWMGKSVDGNVDWRGENKVKKTCFFNLEFPVSRKIVFKYLHWKKLFHLKAMTESNIEWTLKKFMEWFPEDLNNVYDSNQEVEWNSFTFISGLRSYIEKFLNSFNWVEKKFLPSDISESEGVYSFSVEDIWCFVNFYFKSFDNSKLVKYDFFNALLKEPGKPGLVKR